MVQISKLNISLDKDTIRPLCMQLPQKIGYVKCFKMIIIMITMMIIIILKKTMSFKVIDNKLLKKYIKT